MSIAVGFATTPEAAAALSAAVSEAALRGTGLRLYVPAGADAASETEALGRARDEARAADVALDVVSLEEDADLGDALIDASYRADTDVVVIGLRRRSPMGKLLLGSLSQRILLEAGCAVHAVKVRVGPRG
ncbi:universal stress protein [Arthrobacter halodurans]|jgi:nucleotide-binding universal stress UspA family protein|uniref:Universal stress protein n=1 Tax=Arthrobacter halodurans TaxID=516699 RepID=A0ABV4USB1_9MICC